MFLYGQLSKTGKNFCSFYKKVSYFLDIFFVFFVVAVNIYVGRFISTK